MRENPERIPLVVSDTHEALARRVAERIAAVIRTRRAEGRRPGLGLAPRSSPIGIYRELIRMHREEQLSFADVVTFNLDEYHPMPAANPHSYHRFMWENFFDHVDVAPAHVHIPRGDLPRDAIEAEAADY